MAIYGSPVRVGAGYQGLNLSGGRGGGMPVHIDTSNNGIIRRGRFLFAYQDIMHADLDRLRESEHLDAALDGAKSEFEIITRMAAWANRRGTREHSEKEGGDPLASRYPGLGTEQACGSYCLLLADALFSMGIQSRYLSLTSDVMVDPATGRQQRLSHAVGDVWSNDYAKWILVDANFGCTLHDGSDTPQSAHELQAMLLAGRADAIHPVFCGPYEETTAVFFERFPFYRDSWFPSAYKQLNVFHNVNLLDANNRLDNRDWQDSRIGSDGEEQGARRIAYEPRVAGFNPFHYDHQHYVVTDDLRDVTWNLYDVEMAVGAPEPLAGSTVVVPLTLRTVAPGLDYFLLREDGRDWQEMEPSRVDGADAELEYAWRCDGRLSTLEVRARNSHGRMGVIRSLTATRASEGHA